MLLAFFAAAAAAWRAGDLLDWVSSLRLNSPDLRVALLLGWALVSASASGDVARGLLAVLAAVPFFAVFALLRTNAGSRAAALHATCAAALVNALVGLGQWMH